LDDGGEGEGARAPAAGSGGGVSASGAGLAGLRPELAARVAVVGRLAAEMDVAAYLVGGTVRDLLLGRDGPDLDFVVVGDGMQLAAAVERELGGRLVRHPAFLTADVIDAGGVHLDLATARQESYPAVAALPEVRPAALEDDLLRRDFTVNAMALPLAPGQPAGVASEGLIDPSGGRRDLAAGALRVLHHGSFLDDPTRVLRGVRFEARLGFRLTAESEELARQAVTAGAFGRLSGSRLRHELELLLGAEPAAALALPGTERLAELGVLAAVHPRLALDAAARRRLRAAAAELAWHRAAGSPPPPARPWLVLLLALAMGLLPEERRQLAERLLLAGDELRLVVGAGSRLAEAAARLGAGATAPEVDEALGALGGEELLLLAADSDALGRSWVRRYLTELRPFVLGIRGADLLAAGARSGPEIGDALRATRRARLAGEIGPGEELDFALAWLAGSVRRDRGHPTEPGW
jgi:tRNA nucleotidyltransferase (CCA-adding enzyme)